MQLQKIGWAIRLLVKKPFFKKVGFLSYIGPESSLLGMKNITIGSRVRIHPGSRMETMNHGEIVIEDDCSIAQNFHIISNCSKLVIGKNTTIAANVFITNVDHEYKEIDQHILKQKLISKETYIGENCFIGFGTVIQAGTKLGRQCIVGANSVVRGKFPDYCVIVGVPAKIVKQYNEQTKEWERI